MTIEARANRESRNTRGLFAWLAAALVLTASFTANDGAAVVSASFASAASSTFPPVTGDSIDPLFTQPYVDIDEWRDAPDAGVMAHPAIHQRLADIGAGADREPEAVARVLVDETKIVADAPAPLSLADPGEIDDTAVAGGIEDLAGGRRQMARDAVEQRRLA